jgi:hypothetical protein
MSIPSPHLTYRSATIRLLAARFILPSEVMFCIWQRCAPQTRVCLINAITYVANLRVDWWGAFEDYIHDDNLACLQWASDYRQLKPWSACAIIAIKYDRVLIVRWLLDIECFRVNQAWLDVAIDRKAHKCIALFNTML